MTDSASRAEAAMPPVFVLGAPRSGASMLACALAQHPRLSAPYREGWLADLCSVLERGDASAVLAEDSLARGGQRWVEASAELWRHAATLVRLFPGASFIHVVREADLAALACAQGQRGADSATGGTQVGSTHRTGMSLRDAYATWLEAVRGCIAGLADLGPQRSLAVRHASVVGEPEGLVRQCLDFLGEVYAAQCLRPLRGLAERALTQADLRLLGAHADDPAVLEARALTRQILGEATPVRSTLNGARPSATQQDRATADPPGSKGRIAMVTEYFPKFSETFVVEKFRRLTARGWDAHLVCNQTDAKELDSFPEIAAAVKAGDHVHFTGDLDAELLALEPDIVHFEYGALARGRMYLRDLLDCAIVVSFRGYDLNYFGVDDDDCYSDVWEGADLLHLVSDDIWARAQRRGCPPVKAHVVIRDAVDTSDFVAPAREVPQRLGTAERPLRVLSVGRLHWKKGYEYGLAALRALSDEGIEWRYRIVGEGEHREAVLFAADDLEIAHRVELTGRQDHEGVKKSMRWADVFLHPAVSEGFCVAAVEAQAMGLPVVCTDADGLSENVADGESGLVVERRDAAALARVLAALARDPGRLLELGRAGRRRAQEAHDARQQIDEFEETYQRLVAELRARGGTPAAGHDRLALPADRDTSGPRDGTTLKVLRAHLARLESQIAGLRENIARREAADAAVRAIAASVPEGAHVLVVSKGDEQLMDVPGRHAYHFPLAPTGVYAGFHPADSGEAVEHLEELRRAGAAYLAFPAASGWWLDFYEGLRHHLEAHYRLVATDDSCVVFAIAQREVVRA